MLGGRHLTSLPLRLYQKIRFVDQWYLMFDLGQEMSTSFGEFRALVPPTDRFWADPHVVYVDGHYYIFVEEYSFMRRKGCVSVIEMDADGNYKNPVRVLERPYHLSYPFVFAYDGRYYMVPETAQNHSIELYECLDFPKRWEFKMNLMDGIDAVDTTLLHRAGKWWLFTAMVDGEASLPLPRTYLFFADELLTNQWHPHPLNPIQRDVRRGRSAGKIFTKNGRLMRPSQESSEIYGYGFDLNEILSLSETDYVETRVMAVRPDWDQRVLATHTFANEGQLTVIDAFMRRSRLRAWLEDGRGRAT